LDLKGGYHAEDTRAAPGGVPPTDGGAGPDRPHPGGAVAGVRALRETIRNWVKQADLDEGRRHDGLRTEEKEELRRLRRENRQLRIEREILKKAATWFAREADSSTTERSSS
jgi:hypothetical protein